VRRYGIPVAIVACLAAGVFLLLLALDVGRWRTAMASDDVTYRSSPQSQLWAPRTFLPAGVSRFLLGVGDDIAYRRALRAFRLARIAAPALSDPSEAANLLGAIAYSQALADFTNRARLIVAAAQQFGQAVTFDPSNDDAKYNLELTLALGRATGLSESGGGTNPTPGGKGAKGAGVGTPGTGF